MKNNVLRANFEIVFIFFEFPSHGNHFDTKNSKIEATLIFFEIIASDSKVFNNQLLDKLKVIQFGTIYLVDLPLNMCEYHLIHRSLRNIKYCSFYFHSMAAIPNDLPPESGDQMLQQRKFLAKCWRF